MTERSEVDVVFSKLTSVVSDETAAREAIEHIRRLPCWTEPIEPRVLPGGLSNINFVVETSEGRYVVRFGPDMPDLGSFRWREAAALRAAHAVGVAPRVVYAADSVIVMEFVVGRVLAPADLRDPAVSTAVIKALRTLHSRAGEMLDGPDFMLWPFHHCRWYLRQALARADRLDLGRLEVAKQMQSRIGELQRVIGDVRIVFGHGDLVPQNILLGPDGVKFVDLEYAGFAPDLFDLAGLAMNCELDTHGMRSLLESYWEHDVSPDQLRRFCAMVLIAGIRESAWSFKSETEHKRIDFDYSIYSQMCSNRQARLEDSLATILG